MNHYIDYNLLHGYIFEFLFSISMFRDTECKYDDVAFSDCDPIKLTKWRQNHLIAGGALCEKIKNETKSCDTADFPPGMCLFILSP